MKWMGFFDYILVYFMVRIYVLIIYENNDSTITKNDFYREELKIWKLKPLNFFIQLKIDILNGIIHVSEAHINIFYKLKVITY